ncbi:hypothetical protein GCM10009555_024880 [Acrocarpospora macrocephala]|uniref:Uncharacterized protein n=1 Tax=Acrocarpospora macrocephala TaxID=150177 RepID=A0A5M3WQF7_9ACTN|nr:hypothetical protein [Acrocarpospora macrocephala]GES10382.1 hypothetical protein Amac_039790 [Acrocarpospora macrocephala]
MPNKTTVLMLTAATALGIGAGVAANAAIGGDSTPKTTVRATIGGAITPHATAAAVVKANGAVVRSTGVTAVRRIATGQYCVYLEPNIDATKTIPVATKMWGAPWSATVLVYSGNTACGTGRHVFVGTGYTTGGAHDVPFHVVVP